jgi:hypothetical protein
MPCCRSGTRATSAPVLSPSAGHRPLPFIPFVIEDVKGSRSCGIRGSCSIRHRCRTGSSLSQASWLSEEAYRSVPLFQEPRDESVQPRDLPLEGRELPCLSPHRPMLQGNPALSAQGNADILRPSPSHARMVPGPLRRNVQFEGRRKDNRHADVQPHAAPRDVADGAGNTVQAVVEQRRRAQQGPLSRILPLFHPPPPLELHLAATCTSCRTKA